MNQYEEQNAIFKLCGYFIPSGKQVPEEAFEEGKAELVKRLRKDIDHIESITFEQFIEKYKTI